jgi:uncharacterized sulfatase
MYDPDDIDVPSKEPGEHETNPPHFQLTPEEDPDFPEWAESGQAMHGLGSHLHDEDELAEETVVY